MLSSLYRYYAIITKVPWLSAKLRNVNREIVHDAIEKEGTRFHGVLKHTGAYVGRSFTRRCAHRRFFIVPSEKWLV